MTEINVMMERNVRFGFKIPQRQEQTKRKLQFVLSVVANSTGFNRGRSGGLLGLRYRVRL